jgi:alpha-L-fucosidase
MILLLPNITLFAQNNSLIVVSEDHQKVAEGKFKPTWESLSQYEAPQWFRNAKFGIWAHWGPQCQPGQGDWFARFMYNEDSRQYTWFVQHYGHPSKFGFKEVINDWKAEKWDPDKLVALYKKAGAQYFVAMANHHDNFDMWNSTYQPWNAVNMGPHKDILQGWARAAKKQKLPFGLSVHASHAWLWFEVAQRSDKKGPMAGIPYDGKLTKEDGQGTWWEGFDPQDLYAQNHPLSKDWENISAIHGQWNWGNGATIPSQAYCDKFYNRTMELINLFKPDLLYFDDTALPLYPVSDAGLKIAAHFYNSNIKEHHGKLEAVLFGKILTPEQKKCLVWDVERGAPDKIQELPWQTCTCIGDWHYNYSIYENNRYKWKIFGEGPAAEASNPINAQGFNENKIKFSSHDLRFTQHGNDLYIIVMGEPTANIIVKSLNNQVKIKQIDMLGSKEKVSWHQNDQQLEIDKPDSIPNKIALVYKVKLETRL